MISPSQREVHCEAEVLQETANLASVPVKRKTCLGRVRIQRRTTRGCAAVYVAADGRVVAARMRPGPGGARQEQSRACRPVNPAGSSTVKSVCKTKKKRREGGLITGVVVPVQTRRSTQRRKILF